MDPEDIIQTIASYQQPVHYNNDRSYMYVRCPYCGDSRNDSNHAHCGITTKPPFFYHCVRCDTGGIVNAKFLNDIGINDNDLVISIDEINRKAFKDSNLDYRPTVQKPISLSSVVSKSYLTDNSLKYFNTRFGTSLDAKYVTEKFKAVLDSQAFFRTNKLIIKDKDFDFENSIGFVSNDEGYCIFRDITGSQDRRYHNLRLAPKSIDCGKIYNIRSQIDVLCEKPTLVMTEGIFDIIGIYLARYKDTPEEKNAIFAAGCGKGYNAVISDFVHKGFLDMNIVIYSDNDVSLDFLRNVKAESKYLGDEKWTIYYNELSKDVGVPADQIRLRKAII